MTIILTELGAQFLCMIMCDLCLYFGRSLLTPRGNRLDQMPPTKTFFLRRCFLFEFIERTVLTNNVGKNRKRGLIIIGQ